MRNAACNYVGFRLVLLLTFLGDAGSFASAHSFGQGEQDITPPIRREIEEIKKAKRIFGANAATVRGVVDKFRLWKTGEPLRGCFFDGDLQVREFFVKTANEWVLETSIQLDFGGAPDFRTCGPEPSDIRVSFSKEGYWSYVGTDSRSQDILQEPSLNIDLNDLPFTKKNRPRLREIILHEVGHALGLQHEHQSPRSNCERQFNWKKIYEIAKKDWKWEKEEVDHNFRVLLFSDVEATDYDTKSIMHYSLPSWMFTRGKRAECYVVQAKTLSGRDKSYISSLYPPKGDDAVALRAVASVASAELNRLGLTREQIAEVGLAILRAAKGAGRKGSIKIDLAPPGYTPRSSQLPAVQPCRGDSADELSGLGICEIASDNSFLTIKLE